MSALATLLPPSLRGPDIDALSAALGSQLDAAEALSGVPHLLARVHELEGEALGALADYVGVRFWTDDLVGAGGLGDEAKRAFIRMALPWHRRRGTAQSVREALAVLGFPSALVHERADVEARAFAAGARTLDGSWSVGDADVYLVPVEAGGLPRTGTFEFVAELDFDADPVGAAQFGPHVIRAVEASAPARARAVFLLRYTPGKGWPDASLSAVAAFAPGYVATPFPDLYTAAFSNPPSEGTYQRAVVLRSVAVGFATNVSAAVRDAFRGFEPEDRPAPTEPLELEGYGFAGRVVETAPGVFAVTVGGPDAGASAYDKPESPAGFVVYGDGYALQATPSTGPLSKYGGGLSIDTSAL